MKLLTKALLDDFAKTGQQSEDSDPFIIAKFFNPSGGQTWYASEFIPSDGTFFGYVSLFGDHNDEWGYFSLAELESVRGALGLGIERDRHFTKKRFSALGID